MHKECKQGEGYNKNIEINAIFRVLKMKHKEKGQKKQNRNKLRIDDQCYLLNKIKYQKYLKIKYQKYSRDGDDS